MASRPLGADTCWPTQAPEVAVLQMPRSSLTLSLWPCCSMFREDQALRMAQAWALQLSPVFHRCCSLLSSQNPNFFFRCTGWKSFFLTISRCACAGAVAGRGLCGPWRAAAQRKLTFLFSFAVCSHQQLKTHLQSAPASS